MPRAFAGGYISLCSDSLFGKDIRQSAKEKEKQRERYFDS